jgi:hypothetical protein
LCGWLVTGHPTPSYGDEQEDMNIIVCGGPCAYGRSAAPSNAEAGHAFQDHIAQVRVDLLH